MFFVANYGGCLRCSETCGGLKMQRTVRVNFVAGGYKTQPCLLLFSPLDDDYDVLMREAIKTLKRLCRKISRIKTHVTIMGHTEK